MHVYIITASFLITLQSYYFYGLNLSLLVVVGSIAIIAWPILWSNSVWHIDRRTGFMSIVFLFTVLWLVIRDLYLGKLDITLYLGLIIGTLVFISVSMLSIYKKDIVLRALKFSLIVHTLCWTAQILFWVKTGVYIDLLEPVTGESQRAWSSKGLVIGDTLVPRVTGFFNEPATYSQNIFAILVGIWALERRSSLFRLFSATTMALSFSLIGLACFALYCGIIFYYTMGRTWFFLGFSILSTIVIYSLTLRLGAEHGNVSERVEALVVLWDLLVSNAYAGIPREVMTDSLNIAARSVGTGLYLVFLIGAPFLISVLAVVKMNRISLFVLFSIGGLLLSDIHPTYGMFWMTLALLFSRVDRLKIVPEKPRAGTDPVL